MTLSRRHLTPQGLTDETAQQSPVGWVATAPRSHAPNHPIAMHSTFLLLVLAFTIGACSTPPRDTPEDDVSTVPLDEPFTVELGEQVALGDKGVVLRFDGVASDNRCPAAVTCIQAGEATAQFTLLEADRPDMPLALQIDGLVTEVQDIDRYQFQTVDRFVAALLLLQPYPGLAGEQDLPVTATLEVRTLTR